MLTLIWRQFRKSITVQAAMVLLFASAVVVFMVYAAYIKREAANMSVRFEPRINTGFYLVTLSSPLPSPDPKSQKMMTAPFKLVAAWNEGHVNSNLGKLPVTVLDDSPRVREVLAPGTAAIHHALAKRLGIKDGDSIRLNLGGRLADITVVKTFAGIFGDMGYNFGERVLIFSGQPQSNTSLLFQQVHPTAMWTINQLRNSYPHALIEDVTSDQSLALRLVNNNYEQVKQAQLGLIIFVAIAFLTAKVMAFMDGRKTLAILKAMGLKNIEVGSAIALEGLLSPLCGVVLGITAGTFILRTLEHQGTGLAMSYGYILTAILCVVPAALVGIVVPSRFAQMGSVNELLFERAISLLCETVCGLSRRYPALEPYMARGVHFVKLDMVDGNFEGYIFRRIGDTVKQGEVIAVSNRWWGLKSRQVVAPIGGTIVYFQEETGFIGVGPEDLLHWHPEKPVVMKRLVTVSQD